MAGAVECGGIYAYAISVVYWRLFVFLAGPRPPTARAILISYDLVWAFLQVPLVLVKYNRRLSLSHSVAGR